MEYDIKIKQINHRYFDDASVFILWRKPSFGLSCLTIEFLDGYGTLIMPIREELYIHILDGSIKK